MQCQQCQKEVVQGENSSGKARLSGLCNYCWFRPFQITSVCRADLTEVLTVQEIVKLRDGEMEEFASDLADAYLESGIFWGDLGIVAREILGNK